MKIIIKHIMKKGPIKHQIDTIGQNIFKRNRQEICLLNIIIIIII
jgi:hypothetical protein